MYGSVRVEIVRIKLIQAGFLLPSRNVAPIFYYKVEKNYIGKWSIGIKKRPY